MDIVVCEHAFRAGSFFTYRKHRVLPNIQYLLAYKSTSTYYIQEIHIYMGKEKRKKKEYGGLFIVIVTQYFRTLTESRFDEGKKTHLSSYFIFVAKIRSPNSFSHKKYYCASSNLKNIIIKRKKKTLLKFVGVRHIFYVCFFCTR